MKRQPLNFIHYPRRRRNHTKAWQITLGVLIGIAITTWGLVLVLNQQLNELTK